MSNIICLFTFDSGKIMFCVREHIWHLCYDVAIGTLINFFSYLFLYMFSPCIVIHDEFYGLSMNRQIALVAIRCTAL